MKVVRGGDKLRRVLRKWPDDATEFLKATLHASADELADAITEAAPKRTGAMARAASDKASGGDGLKWYVGYSPKRPGFKQQWKHGGFKALWNEFGTKKMKAQPFIRPTFRRMLPAIVQSIEKAVRRSVARQFG